MRVAWALVLVSSAATAAPPPQLGHDAPDRVGACLRENPSTILAKLTASGAKVTFCLDDKDTEGQGCIVVDLGAGTFRWAGASTPTAAATQVVTKAGKASWCEGSTCIALDVPPWPDPYPATLSPDGKRLAIVIRNDVVVVEVATGKTVRTLTIGDDSHPLEFPAAFAGDAIYAARGVEILTGWFVRPDGTKIVVENVAPGAPVHVAGSRWAVTAEGTTLVVADVATGAVKRRTQALPDEENPKSRGKVCSYCIGGVENNRVPAVAVLGSGDLVSLSALGLTVFDHKTLAPKRTLAYPICPSPPPGRSGE